MFRNIGESRREKPVTFHNETLLGGGGPGAMFSMLPSRAWPGGLPVACARMAGRQTPATRLLEEAGVPFTLHEYGHDPAEKSFGLEAATALALDAGRVFKTLVVQVGNLFRVCIVPAAATLDL